MKIHKLWKCLISVAILMDCSFANGQAQQEFDGWALQSNFSLPLVRYNFPYHSSDNGSLEYFNAAGGGFGFSWGRITIKSAHPITDTTLRSDLDIEMANVIGFGGGFVFSQNNTDSTSKSIFAPVIYVSILNFQTAVGYELGDRISPNSRFFLTVTINIPISKLFNTGSYILTTHHDLPNHLIF